MDDLAFLFSDVVKILGQYGIQLMCVCIIQSVTVCGLEK